MGYKIALLCLLIGIASIAGCGMPSPGLSGLSDYPKYFNGINSRPRNRLGCYPTATATSFFPDPDNLGFHSYSGSFGEKNGILYTCRGGHIDLTHIRIASDWTAYLAARTFVTLMSNEDGFSYRFNTEPSLYTIDITYPESWKHTANKEELAYDLSIKVGKYLAFLTSSWHEILTWYGYKVIAMYPEYPSAFSWEDSYSNLVGVRIGGQALRNKETPYNQAVEAAINTELKNLGLLSGDAAKRISETVKNTWYSGNFCFVDMRKRNFDIGVENGYVTPTLVPNVEQCPGAKPQPYPAPTLDFLLKHGIQLKVKITPREWEKGKILSIVYPDKNTRKNFIEPAKHLPIIMTQIKKEAQEKYGDIN